MSASGRAVNHWRLFFQAANDCCWPEAAIGSDKIRSSAIRSEAVIELA
jgi:hypothetical protein